MLIPGFSIESTRPATTGCGPRGYQEDLPRSPAGPYRRPRGRAGRTPSQSANSVLALRYQASEGFPVFRRRLHDSRDPSRPSAGTHHALRAHRERKRGERERTIPPGCDSSRSALSSLPGRLPAHAGRRAERFRSPAMRVFRGRRLDEFKFSSRRFRTRHQGGGPAWRGGRASVPLVPLCASLIDTRRSQRLHQASRHRARASRGGR